VPVEVRLYDRLFKVERPDLEDAPMDTLLNPNSLEILTASRVRQLEKARIVTLELGGC
jgi:hypothetical protein